jgi:hypothetical protein
MMVPQVALLVQEVFCNRKKLGGDAQRLIGRKLDRLLAYGVHYPHCDYAVAGEAVLLCGRLALDAERIPVRFAFFVLPPMDYFLVNRRHNLKFQPGEYKQKQTSMPVVPVVGLKEKNEKQGEKKSENEK